MSFTVYEWERRHYTKDGGFWVEDAERREVRYITEEWRDIKTGEDEANFWLVLGGTFDVERDMFGDPVFVEGVSPDGMDMFQETFEEFVISDALTGWRELTALRESEGMRIIPVLESTDEHIVLQFGNETKANYDLVTERWVG